MPSKNFSTYQISEMVNEVREYGITVSFVDEQNEAMIVEANGMKSSISFKDFKIDLDIFLDSCLMFCENRHKINFKMEDLKQARLNPECTCGGNVVCNYDGELTENYYFTCECGATEVLNGYWLDSLLD